MIFFFGEISFCQTKTDFSFNKQIQISSEMEVINQWLLFPINGKWPFVSVRLQILKV